MLESNRRFRASIVFYESNRPQPPIPFDIYCGVDGFLNDSTAILATFVRRDAACRSVARKGSTQAAGPVGRGRGGDYRIVG